jgi:hypothetical protein
LGDALSPPLIGAVAQRTSLALAIRANALPVLVGGAVLLVAVKAFGDRARPQAKVAPSA